MNEKNPWDGIPNAGSHGGFSARKVSRDHNPRGIPAYWAVDLNGRIALLVEYSLETWHPARLPEFENIELQDSEEDKSTAFILLDSQMRDIFLDICLDVISYLQDLPDAQRGEGMLLRLERWSLLLKPTRREMSEEQQKGLIAELLFLKDDVLSMMDEASALETWSGPLQDARDFSFGDVFVEVKSKRNASTPHISISSENQLSTNPSEKLFLYVLDIDRAPQGKGFTVTDIAHETRSMIESPLQQSVFDNKLASVGYFEEDDYSGTRWVKGASYYYTVLEDFPRIDSKSCNPGVSRVTYQIDLDYCDEYRVDRATIIETME